MRNFTMPVLPVPPSAGGGGYYQGPYSSGQTVGGPGSGSMSMSGMTPELAYAYGLWNPQQGGAALPGGGGGVSGGSSGSSNPLNQSAMNFLDNVVSGRELPFDQGTQNNLLSQASSMNAAAESARNTAANQAALAGGASASDPSLQGQRAQSMSERQSGNAKAAQDIGASAHRENFGARMDAAGQVSRFELAEQERRRAATQSLSGQGGGGPYGGGRTTPQVGGYSWGSWAY